MMMQTSYTNKSTLYLSLKHSIISYRDVSAISKRKSRGSRNMPLSYIDFTTLINMLLQI